MHQQFAQFNWGFHLVTLNIGGLGLEKELDLIAARNGWFNVCKLFHVVLIPLVGNVSFRGLQCNATDID